MGSLLDTLWQDLRYGLRNLVQQPGFTFVAVLTLAIAIGANSAIFSFIDGVLLKPLPFPKPEEIVTVWEKPPGGTWNSVSAQNFLDWQAQTKTVQHLSAVGWAGFTWTGNGQPQQINARLVSAPYFQAMGIEAALGRTFSAEEDQPGKENVVVLTNRAWKDRFGGQASILDRKITLNGKPYTVIGVLPAGYYDRGFAEIWAPLAFTPDRLTRNFHWLQVVGRLAPGATMEKARAEMQGIADHIAQDYPDSNKGWSVTLEHFTDRMVGDKLRQSLYVLLTAVGAVLLIGCANLANLMLARSTVRAREVAVRTALGASRSRIVRQILTESVLVSAVGAAAGIALGYLLMQAMKLAMPPFFLPARAEVAMDWRVFLFTAVVAVFTGVLCGLAPAWQTTRGNTAGALKEGGRSQTSGASHHRLRGALIVSEVALAFMLLAGAGLLLRSFVRLLNVDPGFETANIITMGFPRVMGQDVDSARLTDYYRTALERVSAVPGVRDVALTSALPLQGWDFGMGFQIAGRPLRDRADRPSAGFKPVTPSYFRALGMHLRRGREFTERDVAGTPPVMVINETFARRFFDQQDPIGQRVLIEQIVTGKRELGPEIPWEVVGVVADEKTDGLDRDDEGVYVPLAQSPVVGVSMLVRAAGDPGPLVRSVQEAVWSMNKDQALTDVKTLDQIKSESLGPNKLRTELLGIFAAIALALAAVGVYGVMSYTVAQRTHEMGIRAALGASAGDLLRLVVGHGMQICGAGLVLGALGAAALTRFLASLLFQVSPTDAVTMATVAGVLAAIALLACYVPARRATRVDPIAVLRME